MSQPITSALREWIIAQAEQGFAADVVLKSMMDSGWKEEVAILALETTLQKHIANTAQASATATTAEPSHLGQSLAQSPAKALASTPLQTDSAPPIVAVPRPSVDDSPLYIDVGDRRVSVLSSMAKPHIIVFGNVLSDEDCDALIAAAKPRLNRSLTVETKTGGEELNADRTSNGMFFRRDENEVVAALEKRLAALANWPIQNGEGLQVLHYRPGTEYKPHYDYFDPVEPGTATILKRGGQRVATIIVYLSEPEKGGGTTFPDVQLEVAPKRGNAVFFSYDCAHPNSKSLHGGAPVIAGEKWIATKWLREREFV
jgi:prolyl 4-hydroxylase